MTWNGREVSKGSLLREGTTDAPCKCGHTWAQHWSWDNVPDHLGKCGVDGCDCQDYEYSEWMDLMGDKWIRLVERFCKFKGRDCQYHADMTCNYCGLPICMFHGASYGQHIGSLCNSLECRKKANGGIWEGLLGRRNE